MSRELDARVARAMGWTLWGDFYPVNAWIGSDGLTTGYCDQPWMEDDLEWYGDLPSMISGLGVWAPSTDIAAAFQVVEWMEQRTPSHMLALARHIDEWAAWFSVPLHHPEYNTRQYGRLAPTAPEAICLVFLAAMEAI